MAHLLLCGLSLFSQCDWYKFIVVRFIVKSYMQCLMISVHGTFDGDFNLAVW